MHSADPAPHPADPVDPTDPADLGVLEAAALLRRRTLSSLELTEACLRRVEERNGGPPTHDGAPDALNAWVRLYPEEARAEARAADERLATAARGADGEARARALGSARGEGVPEGVPLLCGIPLAVKDLYAVAGRPLTASSRVLEGHVARRDADVMACLRAAGTVVMGHTHTHEFAAGGTADQVGNPWDLSRVAGGSSGGSAAALAARMVPAALGTDTCGSLRIPSACCGTSTIKPTHGRVSIEGIIPLAPSLDHPGPMARSVADCAVLLSAMAAAPAVSPLSPPAAPMVRPPLASRPGRRPLEGTVLAVTGRGRPEEWDPAVVAGLDAARQACERLGARVVARPAPWEPEWDDINTILLTEAWLYHRRHAERADRYRPAVAAMVEAARGRTDAAAYLAAQRRRAEGTAAWEEWFRAEGVDAVLEPTLAVLPPLRGGGYERGRPAGAGDPMIRLTALWDMTGMPVVSLPVTWGVGVSLAGPGGAEMPLAQVAVDLQERELGVPSFPPSASPVRSGRG